MANIPENIYENAPTGQHTWIEPPSAADEENPPVYPHCKVWETESGHSIQMDDTKNRERVRIEHRSQTFLEMHPNGDEVHNIKGDGYEIIAKNKNVLIKGLCHITIEGDCHVHIKGDKIEQIDGNYIQNIGKDLVQNVNGTSYINAVEDMNIGVSGVLGGVTIQSPTNTVIDSDLETKGDISGININAQAKVNGKTGVTAGYLGFVSSTGGLSIGVPVAIPGQILCSGNLATLPEIDPITGATIVPAIPANPIGNITATGVIQTPLSVFAGVSMISPFIQGAIVRDSIGTMMTMRAQYNTHLHPGHVAGTPTSPMI